MIKFWEEQLRALAHLVPCEFWSHSFGEATPYDGWDMGLETGELRLELGFSNIHSAEPRVEYANLCSVAEDWRRDLEFRSGPLDKARLQRHLRRLGKRFGQRLPINSNASLMCAYGNGAAEPVLPEPANPQQLAVYRVILKELCGDLHVAIPPDSSGDGGGDGKLDKFYMDVLFATLQTTLPQLRRETLEGLSRPLLLHELAGPTITLAAGPDWTRASQRSFWKQHPRVEGIVRLPTLMMSPDERQALVMAGLERPGQPCAEPTTWLLARDDAGWTVEWKGAFPPPDEQALEEAERLSTTHRLAVAGYTLVEREQSCMRLLDPDGLPLLVATEGWLCAQVSDEAPYFIAPDRLIILRHFFCVEAVLEALTSNCSTTLATLDPWAPTPAEFVLETWRVEVPETLSVVVNEHVLEAFDTLAAGQRVTVATGWWLYRTMEQHSSFYRPSQPLILVRAMDPPLVRQALADFTQKSNNPLTNRSQPG